MGLKGAMARITKLDQTMGDDQFRKDNSFDYKRNEMLDRTTYDNFTFSNNLGQLAE